MIPLMFVRFSVFFRNHIVDCAIISATVAWFGLSWLPHSLQKGVSSMQTTKP